MCRRKQFSDKITLFLATQSHAVEFVMWLLAVGGKSVHQMLPHRAVHSMFQVEQEAEVTILFRRRVKPKQISICILGSLKNMGRKIFGGIFIFS